MGAWGIGTFENDDALDWLGDYLDSPSNKKILTTLTIAMSASQIDAPQAAEALAAAEIVAAMSGRPAAAVPESLASHLRSAAPTQPAWDLVILAKRVVERVKMESEARALWEEAGEIGDWERVLNDLAARLNGKNR
jgi:hypothetical protein